MNSYRVVWEMDMDAATPEEAAEKALRVHRKVDSIATVFKVTDEFNREVIVDLGYRDW